MPIDAKDDPLSSADETPPEPAPAGLERRWYAPETEFVEEPDSVEAPWGRPAAPTVGGTTLRIVGVHAATGLALALAALAFAWTATPAEPGSVPVTPVTGALVWSLLVAGVVIAVACGVHAARVLEPYPGSAFVAGFLGGGLGQIVLAFLFTGLLAAAFAAANPEAASQEIVASARALLASLGALVLLAFPAAFAGGLSAALLARPAGVPAPAAERRAPVARRDRRPTV
ncbi:MAG TPA: hypothetical protein VM681_07795 [Candidatus Thermoplasmatota archaeon]|nr:hypothetical protein [Candidatus Thermoplasmatota archaeon]